jgi:DNA-binding NarL/FixJ family response regulator
MTQPRVYKHPRTGKPLWRYVPPTLWRDEKFDELMHALELAPLIPEHLIDRYARNRIGTTVSKHRVNRKRKIPPLTEKQRWILQRLADGKTVKEIGEEHRKKIGSTSAWISRNISGDIHRAMGRIAAETPTQAVVLALAMGLIEQPTRVPGTPGYPLTLAGAGSTASEPLTKRERSVLRLITNGYDNAAIAARLGLGVETVKSYSESLLHKYGARNRAHLAALAVRLGHVI